MAAVEQLVVVEEVVVGAGGTGGAFGGGGAASTPYVTVTRPNSQELKLAINLPVQFVRAAKNLRLDLEQLGLEGAGQLVDLDAQGDVTVDAAARLRLNLGFELLLDNNGAATEPRPFVYEDSSIDVTLSANSQNINLKASVLGIGLEVRKGAISLDNDGPGPSHAPALLSVGMSARAIAISIATCWMASALSPPAAGSTSTCPSTNRKRDSCSILRRHRSLSAVRTWRIYLHLSIINCLTLQVSHKTSIC